MKLILYLYQLASRDIPKILAALNYNHARSLILGMAARCENKWGYSVMYRRLASGIDLKSRKGLDSGIDLKLWKGLDSGPFIGKVELGFFHFLEKVTGWLAPSAGHKIPVQPGWYLPLKIPLAENRFLQAGKGAENTKEKSRQCFTGCKN